MNGIVFLFREYVLRSLNLVKYEKILKKIKKTTLKFKSLKIFKNRTTLFINSLKNFDYNDNDYNEYMTQDRK